MEYLNRLIFAAMVLCCLIAFINAEDCEPENCNASTKLVCNGHGTCDCSTCICEEGYSGPTCEECPTCPSPCNKYADCVSCKFSFSETMSYMTCLQVCGDNNYHPVDRSIFPGFGISEGMPTCTRINSEGCLESFKIGPMSGDYRDLYVLDECDRDISKYTSTASPTSSVELTTVKLTTVKLTTVPIVETTEKVTEKAAVKGKPDSKNINTYGKPEQSDAVSGSSDVSDSNNGSDRSKLKMSGIMCALLILVVIL